MVRVVWDDDGHATLLERELRKTGVAHPASRLLDGLEEIDFFDGKRPGKAANHATPPPTTIRVNPDNGRVNLEVLNGGVPYPEGGFTREGTGRNLLYSGSDATGARPGFAAGAGNVGGTLATCIGYSPDPAD